jgi:hypothetical protein
MNRRTILSFRTIAALVTGSFALAAPAAHGQTANGQNEPFVPPKLIAKALQRAECSVPLKEAAASADLAGLGQRLKLVTIPCWRAAYNFGSILFALDPADQDNARQLRFEVWNAKKFITTYQLSNVNYDEKKRTLGSLHKGRGVGDCGSIGEWKWTGRNFKLTGFWHKDECDGTLFENDKRWRVFPRR